MGSSFKYLQLNRRWRLRSREPASYSSPGLFCPSPDSGYAKALELFSLEEILGCHPESCIFLLGRPGAGKTAEFEMHFLQNSLQNETIIALKARELDQAGSAGIFQSPQWAQAMQADKPIRLVFDSVDEALLSSASFLDGLLWQLQGAKAALANKGLPLSLVLTSRQGWNQETADRIAELWGQREAACTYELAPLTEEAACRLAESKGVKNGRVFLQTCSKSNMAEYACWPRTLIWLAERADPDGALPDGITLSKLHQWRVTRYFEDPDRLLCANVQHKVEKWNKALEILACVAIGTGTRRFTDGTSPGKEMTLNLARINHKPSTTTCGRQTGTALGSNRGSDSMSTYSPPAILRPPCPSLPRAASRDDVCDLCGLAELASTLRNLPEHLRSESYPDRLILIEALRHSELFVQVNGGWHFQEQSDAEFLAAQRLARMPVEFLTSFFARRLGRGWKAYPQLMTTAAMVAVHSDAFLQFLLANDPLVLLHSDFAVVPEIDRKCAVDALLKLVESGNAPDAEDHTALLHTLAHSGLADQLAAVLRNRELKPETRNMALLIATKCASRELADTLGEIIWGFINGPELQELDWLPLAMVEVGVVWPKDRLLAIAKREAVPDPHWRIVGAALFALFNERRSPDERGTLSEVIEFLDHNPTGVIGLYDQFLYSCAQYLRRDDPDEICAVLKVLALWNSALDEIAPLNQLAEQTLQAAVAMIPSPAVTTALAAWWIERVKKNDSRLPGRQGRLSLADLGLDEPTKRHCFMEALVQHPALENLERYHFSSLPFQEEDFPWLLQQLSQSKAAKEMALAKWISLYAHRRSLREQNAKALQAAYEESAVLRALLGDAPDGDIVAEMRRIEEAQDRQWALELSRQKREAKLHAEFDAPKEIASALAAFEQGDSKAWSRLLVALSEPASRNPLAKLWEPTHPEELTGWDKVTPDNETNLRDAARQYLIHHPVQLEARGTLNRSMLATRHALALCQERLAVDSELRSTFRREWVEVILHSLYPGRPPFPDLLVILHHIDPATTLQAICTEIEWLWQENRSLNLDFLDPLCQQEPEVAEEVLRVLSQSPLQPESYQTGIAWLIERDLISATDLALSRAQEIFREAPSEIRRVVLGTALLAATSHWKELWPFVAADPEEGLAIMGWLARLARHSSLLGRIFDNIPEHGELVSTLYGWLLKHLPPEPERHGAYTPDSIDHCRDLERACLSALVRAGRSDLLNNAFHFAGVASKRWAYYYHKQAEQNALAAVWEPWPLNQFVEWIASDGGVRITDNDSLLSAIELALRRLEQKWKSLPRHYLWDEKNRQHLREQELSNTLLHYLETELPRLTLSPMNEFVFSREEQFFTGDRQDIFIRKMLPGKAPAQVVIEVKLCDNGDVEKNMQSQLAERYLMQNNLTHGIYFVAWMTTAEWSKSPTAFQKRGLTKARAFLKRQASRLSTDGISIRALVVPLPLGGGTKKRNRRPRRAT